MVSPASRGALLRESDGHVFPSVRARHQPACPPAGFSAIWGQTLFDFFPPEAYGVSWVVELVYHNSLSS